MAIIACIACNKDVEETDVICPHCGTMGPKREMLVPCRVCGETVGKNARRCPHCKSSSPYKKKHIRDNLLFVLLFIAWGFYLSNMGNLHSNRVWDTMTLGGIFLIMLFIIPIWLIYKDLKDSSGLTNFIPLVLQIKKSSLLEKVLNLTLD